MTNVIDFVAALSDRDSPHLSGLARCDGCGHQWEAVAPVGTVILECPRCESMQGRYRYPVQRSETVWECMCGCQTFGITAEHGPYCTRCGLEQSGWEGKE
jgi:hypothetical protein